MGTKTTCTETRSQMIIAIVRTDFGRQSLPERIIPPIPTSEHLGDVLIRGAVHYQVTKQNVQLTFMSLTHPTIYDSKGKYFGQKFQFSPLLKQKHDNVFPVFSC